MKEIRDRITALTTSYEKQLSLYEEIRSVGTQERELIKGGSLDQLLKILQAKESLLQQAAREEALIKSTQDLLAAHFELETFSIPQLKKIAPERYHEALVELENVVSHLLPLLELLEQQEKANESYLNEYIAAVKATNMEHFQSKRAERAYKRRKS